MLCPKPMEKGKVTELNRSLGQSLQEGVVATVVGRSLGAGATVEVRRLWGAAEPI